LASISTGGFSLVAAAKRKKGKESRRMRKKVLFLVYFVILCSLPVPAPTKDSSTDPAQQGVKETIIFIPAPEMKSVLGIEGEGIFVTYGEYKRLYEKAKEEYLKRQPGEFAPPDTEGPVIVQANYSGSVTGEVLQFEARFNIVQNKRGPSLLDFPLKGVGYRNAKLNGKNAQIYGKEGDPRIVIPSEGSHDLVVEFLVPVAFAEKKGSVSFEIPPAMLGHIKITSDLCYEIKLKGLLFTSRRQVGNKVEFFGFMGSKNAISLEINNRRSFGERRVKISSRETHHVFVERDIIHREAEFSLTVRDGEAKGVDIEIGKNDYVYNLSGSGISGWTREDQGRKDVLHVTFHVPISDETQFSLKTYTYVDPNDGSFHVKDTLIKGLFERRGSLFVFYANNTRITTEDVHFLKPLEKGPILKEPWGQYILHRGYGLFNLPYTIAYSFRDVPSRIRCNQWTHVSLERSKIHLHSENMLQGLAPGTTRFMFSFPDDYVVRDVTVLINGKKVREFHHHDKGKNLLAIEITHPVSSKDEVSFILKSEHFLEEDLLKKGSFEIALPVVSYTDTQSMRGTLHLSIDDIFFLEDMTMKGYTPSEEMIDHRPSESKGKKRLMYDFRTLSPQGTVTLSCRKSEQTSNTVSYIAVDQDLLQASAYIRYGISSGSRDSFYFAVPRWENGKINITGADIKEKKKISFAKLTEATHTRSLPDLKDHDIWNVVLQKEVTGTYLLAIDYQKKIEDYGSFSDVPLVMPAGVRNDTGYIVLEASRDTEIKTEKAGLNEVETYEIPTWPSYKPSNRIIESLRYFVRPFTFRIAVLRRDESPVLAAIAEKEDLSYTLGKGSDIFFQFDYTIRSTNLQFLEIRFPERHVLWSATLQGKGIKPRKGDDNTLLFPLASRDDRINLRLTGYVPGRAKWNIWKSFDFHSPGLTIPCMESQIRVFFPKDYSLLKTAGNFEKLPEPDDQKPLVFSFFHRLFSSFYKDMRSFSVFPPLAKRKAARVAGREEPEEEHAFEGTEEGAVTERKRGRYDASKMRDLDLLGPSLQTAPESVAMPSPKYSKKKGILAMNIRIPKQGALLPASKLWGESRLRVTFLSSEWKKLLSIFTVLLFFALGSYLTGKGIMSPSGFLVTTLVLFTFLPLIFLRPLVFLFNGAVLGALLFTVMVCVRGIWKKSGGRSRLGLILVFMLLPCLFFTSHNVRAGSGGSFPDIEIYVPYGEKVPFEMEDSQKVFIPTEDYFLLEFLAKPPYKPKDVFEYENEYTITGFTAKGTLEGDMVRFMASLDVFVNHEKWALIDLPFSNVFIEELKLDGREIPVRIKAQVTENAQPCGPKKDIYEIPVLGFGHHSIDICLYVEIEATPGKKTMAFGFPESLCTDFSLAIKDADLLLEFEEPEDGFYIETTGKGLIARASLSQKSSVKISWFPKKFIKKTERPLIYADCHVDMFMDYEEVLVSQKSTIRVEKSSLASLVFRKHPQLVIMDVFSDKVKNWRTGNKNGETALEVVFKGEITETVDVLIKAKMRVIPGKPVPVVFLEPVDAERIRGNLDLYGPEDYKILVENIEGLKISGTGKEHRGGFRGFVLQKRYSFTGPAFRADILSQPRDRKVYADILGQYIFSEGLLTVHFTVGLDVKENFLTSIRLRIPEGYRIGAVDAERISDHHLRKNNILVLPFQHAVRGKYRFSLVLEKELPGFDAPTMEGIELLDIQVIKGQCLVLFPRGFDVREAKISHIRPINIKTLSSQLGQVDETRFGAKYAYRFKEEPFEAKYEVSREKPSLDVVKVYHARVEDNLVNVKVLSLFTIKNAPVDHFDILAPVQVRDSIKIGGERIKTILKKRAEDGKSVRITVQTVSGIERSYLMEVSFNQYIGKDRVFELPHILFPGAHSRTEFVSVETATVYHIETRAPEALQEVERETIPALPAGINLNNVLWAYRVAGSRDWNYRLELKRLEREKLIKATILREDIKTLIIPQGYALHEINFTANNRVLQFLPLDFPFDAELWSLKVAGEPVGASIAEPQDDGKTKRLLVPLIKSSTGDRNFDIKLVYMTPVPKFGLWGKISLGMVETGDIPVEKTTWTLLLPKSYTYPKFKNNMEEIDITVIEAEKTLGLAKEYEYWTNMARTAKGSLREKAVSNRRKVMTDYLRQQALTQQMQTDLDYRIKGEQQGDKQALLRNAQSQNTMVLNEARDIIESNKPVSAAIEQPEEQAEKRVISGRRNIRGWQFKTRDFAGQDEVRESITSFFRSEDEKGELRKKQEMKREMVPQEKIIPFSKEELRDEFKPGRPYLQKEIVELQPLPAKKSILLKGLRSMDISLPEQGTRLSFKKLGGNPTMTLKYRKKGILPRLFSLVVLLAVTAGTVRIRKWRFPAEKITEFFKGKSISDSYELFMRSRPVKIIPTLMMISAFLLGFPWFIMGLGLNTVLLLRYLSMKRYEKTGYVPPYNYRILLKYFFSYIILASCLLFIITSFHPVFFISLAASTFFNCIYVVVYAVLYFFTKRSIMEKAEENKGSHIPS
jgi:hypothetical protein